MRRLFPCFVRTSLTLPFHPVSKKKKRAMVEKKTLVHDTNTTKRIYVKKICSHLGVYIRPRCTTYISSAPKRILNMLSNTQQLKEWRTVKKLCNESTGLFKSRQRLKIHFRLFPETTGHMSSRARTHARFSHDYQPPVCQGIPVATTARSGWTQCEAEKSGRQQADKRMSAILSQSDLTI